MSAPSSFLRSIPLVLGVLAFAAPAAPGDGKAGKVFLSVEEALELAFPACHIERRTVYLTKKQRKAAAKLAKVDVETRIVHPYVATKKGKLVGTAYFDSHQVRTMRETLMVVVDPEHRLGRIEVLAFAEPEDYLPRGAWYGQFHGKRLDDELNLKRGIHGVTGATLTARATTRAARRVLALHAVTDALPAAPTVAAAGAR